MTKKAEKLKKTNKKITNIAKTQIFETIKVLSYYLNNM